jgi:serine/threonine protein kinase
MQFMPYGSLFRVLASEAVLDCDVRLKMALDTCKGMTFLHSMSILHGDLKSENRMLLDGTKGRLTLCALT